MSVRYNKDGTIDKRCSAYKQGLIFLKDDGSVDKRCSAYKQGLLKKKRKSQQKKQTYFNTSNKWSISRKSTSWYQPYQPPDRLPIARRYSLPPARRHRPVHGKKTMRLYHVTHEAAAQSISSTGQMRRGSDGMFGGGIYFAESISSARYKAQNMKKVNYVIVAEVLVGEEFEVHGFANGAYDDITFSWLYNRGYDSVNAPYGSGRSKNSQPERVVYNMDQVRLIAIRKL